MKLAKRFALLTILFIEIVLSIPVSDIKPIITTEFGTSGSNNFVDIIKRILRDINETGNSNENIKNNFSSIPKIFSPKHEISKRSFFDITLDKKIIKNYDNSTKLIQNDNQFKNIGLIGLNLSNKGLLDIDLDNITKLDNIKYLDLSRNKLKNVHLKNPILTHLNISMNNIQNFTIDIVNQLEFLSIRKNNLKTLNGINLMTLQKINILDLSCNNLITNFQLNIFDNLTKLKKLNLQNNNLTEINKNLFYNLLNIETLVLSFNNIIKIDIEAFSVLPNLQYLDLSFNNIQSESIRGLQGIPDLEGLSIAYNPDLGDNSLQEFVASWSLKELNLAGTGLCRIPAALAQSVRSLILADNWFSVIRCGDFDSYPLLQYLDLSRSHIDDIEDDALGRQELLTTLFLDNNNLKRIPISLPPNLEELFISHNQIMDIQPITFQMLNNLKALDLSGNKILYLPALPLPKLLLLNLQNCELRSLSQAVVKTSSQLKGLYLDNNPIKCTDLMSIAEWASPCRTDNFTKSKDFKSNFIHEHNYLKDFEVSDVCFSSNVRNHYNWNQISKCPSLRIEKSVIKKNFNKKHESELQQSSSNLSISIFNIKTTTIASVFNDSHLEKNISKNILEGRQMINNPNDKKNIFPSPTLSEINLNSNYNQTSSPSYQLNNFRFNKTEYQNVELTSEKYKVGISEQKPKKHKNNIFGKTNNNKNSSVSNYTDKTNNKLNIHESSKNEKLMIMKDLTTVKKELGQIQTKFTTHSKNDENKNKTKFQTRNKLQLLSDKYVIPLNNNNSINMKTRNLPISKQINVTTLIQIPIINGNNTIRWMSSKSNKTRNSNTPKFIHSMNTNNKQNQSLSLSLKHYQQNKKETLLKEISRIENIQEQKVRISNLQSKYNNSQNQQISKSNIKWQQKAFNTKFNSDRNLKSSSKNFNHKKKIILENLLITKKEHKSVNTDNIHNNKINLNTKTNKILFSSIFNSNNLSKSNKKENITKLSEIEYSNDQTDLIQKSDKHFKVNTPLNILSDNIMIYIENPLKSKHIEKNLVSNNKSLLPEQLFHIKATRSYFSVFIVSVITFIMIIVLVLIYIHHYRRPYNYQQQKHKHDYVNDKIIHSSAIDITKQNNDINQYCDFDDFCIELNHESQLMVKHDLLPMELLNKGQQKQKEYQQQNNSNNIQNW